MKTDIYIPLSRNKPDEVVVGDIIHLAVGDMVPADVRIVQAKDLFVNQFALTLAGIGLVTAIPFTSFGKMIELAPLPAEYFAWLALTIVLYMGLATLMKKLYIRHYGELL